MNRTKILVATFLIAATLLAPFIVNSQAVDIVRTDKKELIDDQLFYVHEVQKGQTLYSIARAYNVQLPDIAEYNPSVFEGLAIGQLIQIPVIKGKNNLPDEMDFSNSFYFHYVETGETLYSILIKYETNQDEIQLWNPDFKEPLRTGNRIRIPRKDVNLIELKEKILNQSGRISKSPELIPDGEFDVYEVKKGETLYSLARRFEIPLKDLIELNPSVEDGLSIGELLRVPVKGGTGPGARNEDGIQSDRFQKSKDNDPGETKREGMLKHKVERGETLYSISRKYQVNLDSLRASNPWVQEQLPIDSLLNIPGGIAILVDSVLTLPEDSIKFVWQDDKYFYHKVEKAETLYSICKYYRIKQRRLTKANRQLEFDELKQGDIVQIPKRDVKDLPLVTKLLEKKYARKSVWKTQKLIQKLENLTHPCANFQYQPKVDTFKWTLLLPFYLFENDTLFRNNQERSNTPVNHPKDSPDNIDVNYDPNLVYNKSKVMLEFYQGFLLGIAKKKEDGCQVELNVFDTANRLDSLIHLLANPILQEQDLIIGPVYDQNIHEFNKFSKEYKLNFVSPLLSSPHSWIEDNPYFIQVVPAMETQIRDFSQILSNYYYKNIVLLHYGSEAEEEVVKMFQKYLTPFLREKSEGENFHLQSYQLSRDKAFDLIKPRTEDDKEYFDHPIKKVLREDMPNLIILSSRDRGIVSNTFRYLNTILMEKSTNFDISLAGFPNIRNFENIDMEYFHALQYHTFSTFFVDYDRPEVQNFVHDYRTKFFSEPSQFAFQGYDIAHYFLSVMMEYGPNFQECLDDLNLESFNVGLQNEFYYRTIGDYGGIENQHINVLMYSEDYDINRIDTLFIREEKDFRSTLPDEMKPGLNPFFEKTRYENNHPRLNQDSTNLRLYRRPDQ